jgi:UDP-N-acetylglucosamine acyltransferase
MREIHSTAIVNPRAELAQDVRIGPYCVIGEHVRIGRDTEIESHVVIDGHTQLGERNKIFPFVSIGSPPQDVGYRGEDTRVAIGDDNLIKEFVTINRATTKQDWVTIVGNENFLMSYAHVAHDCRLGNRIIMSNAATLGGHTEIGDHAILGGLAATHQFVRIGAYAFVGGKSGVDRDVPPFMMISGERAKLYGVNRRGLRRHGFSQEVIDGLKKAYRIIWREERSLEEALIKARGEIPSSPELEMLLGFFKGSKRGVLRE